MSRKNRRTAIGIQLFPFLAVLICTMGALIVLLVLMVQQARVDAKTRAAAELAAQPKKNEAEERRQREAFEDELWRQDMLAQQRVEQTEELANKRLHLSHLDDHIRRLEQEAQDLLKRAGDIDRGKQLKDSELARVQAEWERLQQQIAAKKKELEEAKLKRQGKDRWYALVPYDGPNGTRRRPIYIECTELGVVLQPEGVVFKPEDFSGPMGPGNPLDAALRATREYIAQTSGGKDEPYPLLVVRPSGIVAYGAARSAMKSWDEEFGYELVSEDKPLVFGDPDPGLRQILGKTVSTARQKQALLIAAMPRRFQEEETLTSFAPEAQPEIREHLAATGGNGIGGGGAGTGSGMGRGPAGSMAHGGSGGNGPGGGSQTPTGNRSGGASATHAGPSAGGSAAGGAGGTPGGGSSGMASSGTSGQNQIGLSNPFGNPGGGQGGTSAAAQPGGQPGGAMGGMGDPATQQANNQQSGRSQRSPGANDSGAPSGGSSTNGASGTARSGRAGAGSLSGGAAKAGGARGSNWGLPGAQVHTTAITRPIQVVCFRDKIVLLPEKGDGRAAQVVYISPQLMQAEVDAFVSLVQKHMQGWGLAVANGYWKPELRVEVAADAETQFANLRMALEGSGFDVQRKHP